MAAIMGKPMIEFFRLRKDDALFQFLTWYIVLVLERKIEDITELLIQLVGENDERAIVDLTFQQFSTVHLNVFRVGGVYYVEPTKPVENE